MPAGTTATRSVQVPTGVATVTDYNQFVARTLRHEIVPITVADPGAGNRWNRPLPQHGIITELVIAFDGIIDVTPGTGSVTTTDRYPYGLLEQLLLRLNGQDRINVGGIDLAVLDYVRFAAFEPVSDAYPGDIDEDGTQELTTVADAPFRLTWRVPVAVDPVTFAGAVFAQSTSFNAMLQVVRAQDAALFTLAGDGTVAIDGEWKVQVVSFDVPVNSEGALIIPDLSRIHAINAFEDVFSGTGRQRIELVNADAQLMRLLISARNTATNRLQATADAPAAERLRSLALSHGPQERPLVYDPAWLLAGRNNRHYGGLVPYDRLVVDTLKEDPARDAIHMQGLTELAVELEVDPAVAVSAGRVRLVQETLI